MTFKDFAFELDALGLVHLRCASNGHRRSARFIESVMRVLIGTYPAFWRTYQAIEQAKHWNWEVQSEHDH